MAHIAVAYVNMACDRVRHLRRTGKRRRTILIFVTSVVAAYVVMAYVVMAYVVVAYIVMAYIVVVKIVAAYVVIADGRVRHLRRCGKTWRTT